MVTFCLEALGRVPKVALKTYPKDGTDSRHALRGLARFFWKRRGDFVDCPVYQIGVSLSTGISLQVLRSWSRWIRRLSSFPDRRPLSIPITISLLTSSEERAGEGCHSVPIYHPPSHDHCSADAGGGILCLLRDLPHSRRCGQTSLPERGPHPEQVAMCARPWGWIVPFMSSTSIG